MFDIERIRVPIAQYYFKLFNRYTTKKEYVREFITNWISLLDSYSKLPNFIRFESTVPKLERLISPTRSVLIVPFDNTKTYIKNTSIFPLYPFRVQLKRQTICCKEGLDLLILYIKIANIKVIGFLNVGNYKFIIEKIKKIYPKIKCYPPTSLKYFNLINKTVNR